MPDLCILPGLHVFTLNLLYRYNGPMISLKVFHLFFIAVSIVITAYYGIFEITHPSSPGMTSNILAGFSFLFTAGLAAYGISAYSKFKHI